MARCRDGDEDVLSPFAQPASPRFSKTGAGVMFAMLQGLAC